MIILLKWLQNSFIKTGFDSHSKYDFSVNIFILLTCCLVCELVLNILCFIQMFQLRQLQSQFFTMAAWRWKLMIGRWIWMKPFPNTMTLDPILAHYCCNRDLKSWITLLIFKIYRKPLVVLHKMDWTVNAVLFLIICFPNIYISKICPTWMDRTKVNLPSG